MTRLITIALFLLITSFTFAQAAADAGSGPAFEELGKGALKAKDTKTALAQFEKGIELYPAYPGNYYHAAKLYLKSDREVYGILYGELFMNLEPNSKRTTEISKLLHDTYKSQIELGDHIHINMTDEKPIATDEPVDIMQPFGATVFEPIMAVSTSPEPKINIHAMDRIRRTYVTLFFNGKISQKYPNALHEYQRVIDKAGHMEAYNYWLLRSGDRKGFNAWKAASKDKWDSFMAWFPNNRIQLNQSNKFYRLQYGSFDND